MSSMKTWDTATQIQEFEKWSSVVSCEDWMMEATTGPLPGALVKDWLSFGDFSETSQNSLAEGIFLETGDHHEGAGTTGRGEGLKVGVLDCCVLQVQGQLGCRFEQLSYAVISRNRWKHSFR